MEISIRQSNVRPRYIQLLINNGIVLIQHLITFANNPKRLSQKIKLSLSQCEEILNGITPRRPYPMIKLSDNYSRPFKRIKTLIGSLDVVLGGGIRCNQLTEISGEAGTGKSNLCCQIGTYVMSPEGLNGDVLFIHTEGEGKLKLAIKRFVTLAESIGRESLIETKLNVINCDGEFKLMEIINRLPETLSEKPSTKLIIIDSITCAFITIEGKLNYDFYAKRSHKLLKMVKMLSQIAWDKRVAILITNHVSYVASAGENRPAMGRIWSHLCQTKIFLERRGHDGSRCASVTKGALFTPAVSTFTITSDMSKLLETASDKEHN